jgi:tetratricopeptide (TPR) repeat protein
MRRTVFALLLIAGCASRAPVLEPALQPSGAPRSIELASVPFFPQQAYQCGPATLAAVLRYAGVRTDAEALGPRVYLPVKQGSLAIEMMAAVRSFGRIGYQPPPRLDALLAELHAGRPVAVLQNLGLAQYPIWHFAVVIGYTADTDRIILRSGEKRRVEERAFNFMQSWSLADRWALVVLQPGELPASDDPSGYLRALAAMETASPATDVVPAYAAAVQRWPDNAIARLGLANAARRNGDATRAIELYLAALKADPTQLATRNNLADTLYSVGCRAAALQYIDAALAEASPAHPLREVLEQTRAEILAQATREPEPEQCRRWASGQRP